jgi:nucleoside-diphosphate-sugar epimerase
MTRPYAVVTGATGFIGQHLVDRLLVTGTHVCVLTRGRSPLPKRWNGQVRHVLCDNWSEAALRESLHSLEFTLVFHLAAYGTRPGDRDVIEARRINVELPATLVRLCAAHGARMVMAGTFSEYRMPESAIPLTEQAPLETVKVYGASKAEGGLVASELAATLGVGLRILRLFHVYGPGEAAHRLLPSLVSGLMEGRRVALSIGTQTRDFINVTEVVEAFVRADAHIRLDGSPQTWNVCTGVGHSVREFALAVADVLTARRELLGFGDIGLRTDDLPWLVGNGERLATALAWRPETDLPSGIRAAIASMAAGRRLSA